MTEMSVSTGKQQHGWIDGLENKIINQKLQAASAGLSPVATFANAVHIPLHLNKLCVGSGYFSNIFYNVWHPANIQSFRE